EVPGEAENEVVEHQHHAAITKGPGGWCHGLQTARHVEPRPGLGEGWEVRLDQFSHDALALGITCRLVPGCVVLRGCHRGGKAPPLGGSGAGGAKGFEERIIAESCAELVC